MRAGQLRDRALDDLEPDIDLGRDDVLIFDLGLGQRGLLDRRPHHRLGAAVELAACRELEQFGDDRRFGALGHRQIRVVPVRADPEPLQLLALHVDPMLRVGAAFGAELLGRHLVLVELLLAVLLLDLPLDRQPVAVPAGHVGRVLAEQGLRPHHHVLQRMVERMADVDVAVGVGRAVVEDEFLPARARLADALVQTLALPPRKDRRLLLRQPGLHRKVGARKEDGRAVIGLDRVGGVGHWRGL